MKKAIALVIIGVVWGLAWGRWENFCIDYKLQSKVYIPGLILLLVCQAYVIWAL